MPNVGRRKNREAREATTTRSPAATVDCWTRWHKEVPDQRLVDALRARLQQPGVTTRERVECITLLVATVRSGYGADALPELVAIAGDPAAPVAERVEAVAALPIASKPEVAVWGRPLKFRLGVPDDVQVKAKALLEQLSASHIPALRRAAAK